METVCFDKNRGAFCCFVTQKIKVELFSAALSSKKKKKERKKLR
jgi:hypothetical protein